MNDTITISVSKKGELDPVRLFEIFNDGVRKRLPKMAAKRFHDLLINNIETNRYNFSLSPSWVAFKKAKGWDERPFIAEGFYKQNIAIYADEGHLVVGFKRTAMHPRSHKPFGEIAKILEFGRADKNLPARPLWRNTLKEYTDNLPVFLRADIKKMIQEGIKK